jgi:hypothetical protein
VLGAVRDDVDPDVRHVLHRQRDGVTKTVIIG